MARHHEKGLTMPTTLKSVTVKRLTRKHDCDAEIRRDNWAMSGYRKTGDRWTCSCGQVYAHIEDEAEGGAWWPQPDNRRS